MRSDPHAAPVALKLAAWGVVAFLHVPLALIVLYAFSAEDKSYVFPPPALTTEWFGVAWQRDDVWAAIRLSFEVAAVSTAIALVLGTLAAAALARARFFGRDAIALLLILPIALPGIISGISLRSAYHTLEIPFSFWTIVIGHATFCVVVVFNNAVARLRRLHPNLIEASMDLGADGFQTVRHVVLPQLGSALLAGALLAFALSFDEVIVTTFTAGQQTTLPIWMLQELIRPRQRPVTNVVAVVIIALDLRADPRRLPAHPLRRTDLTLKEPAMADIALPTELLIDGAFVAGEGEAEKVLNPATGEVLVALREASIDQVHKAVSAAHRAFDAWSETTPMERSRLLLKLADGIESRAEEFARLESLNCGKPFARALGDEIPAIADCYRYFAGAARCMSGTVSNEYLAGHTSMIRRDPVGVVASIAPWNYPLMMAAWKTAPALAAGNTVVIKPSEQTPLTTLLLARLAAEIFPKGVLNVICGRGATVGQPLVEHPKVAMVSVTGDVSTGRKILQAATGTLKRTHLELGGKAPVIVFDDADLASVVDGLRTFGYYNAGQDCTAACRVYAGGKVYDKLVADLSSAVKSLKVGTQDEPDVEMGPLISDRQRNRVASFVERAQMTGHMEITAGGKVARGRRLLLRAHGGGRRAPGGRDRQARGLRPGRQRDPLHRHRAGHRLGQRQRLRARLERVDAGRRPRDAGGQEDCNTAAPGSTRTSCWSTKCRMAA